MVALWNIIRDFFVQYIFGGVTSANVKYDTFFGRFFDTDNSFYNVTNLFVPIGEMKDSNHATTTLKYMAVGDWLSTTFTIITLVIFIVILFLLLKWLFKTISGLILLK